MSLRQPIVVVLGHVDHGKTTLLDKIRGTSVASREPGAITQWIGASLVPKETLKEICGSLLEKFKFQILIPGLLFIDTPGHETFSNLRRRGGSASDIAILVVDITKGFEPQTIESIEILKARKTPFMVAANKIDAIPGWKPYVNLPFLESLEKQREEVKIELENKIYSLIGELSKFNFKSDRFDRIRDFRTHVAIVPTSAKTGEGIPELLAVLVGLTQAFMKEILKVTSGPGKGAVIEVKEEIGLGATLNAIIYDGTIKVGDKIVVGGKEGVIETHVKALLLPKPLDEIRDPKDKFITVSQVNAAAGVKISAPNLESALAGSPLYVVPKDEDKQKYIKLVEEEVGKLRINTDIIGVILKTDTLGSLEALTDVLKRLNIPVRIADVGDVSKRDIVEAEVVKQKDKFLGVVLAFNVKIFPDAEELAEKTEIPIFKSNIIYRLIEDYTEWVKKEKTAGKEAELSKLIKPGKIKVLEGYIFRRSKPAIIGVEVLEGTIKPKYPLMNKYGKIIGEILRIQDKGKDIQEAKIGMQVAISIDKGIVGRNIEEGDLLYVAVPEAHAQSFLTKFKDELTLEELNLLKEILELKPKNI
ncbi:MAG: translation initiation factor IF-2 [Candidatus Bathyarchaeia archaeon]|nr:translation initiation factor IF-2 [Candidatus Bathyarchaeota archaeon]